jgi:hypothetical protein
MASNYLAGNLLSNLRPGGGGSGVPSYIYGWPAGGPDGAVSEPDVLAQWIFDEASGSIVDEVAGLTLAPVQTGAGSYISYGANISYSPYTELVSPGISLQNNTSNSWKFEKTPETSLAFGAGDFTIEWVSRFAPTNNGSFAGTVFYTCNNSIEEGTYIYFDNINTTPRASVYIRTAAPIATFNLQIPTLTNPFDMKIHKHRWAFNRAGNASYYLDGVLQGFGSMAAFSGQIIPCTKVQIGTATIGANPICGTFFELRVSGNATNNSGGPGGG